MSEHNHFYDNFSNEKKFLPVIANVLSESYDFFFAILGE